jgi:lysophospholipid acyltransferase
MVALAALAFHILASNFLPPSQWFDPNRAATTNRIVDFCYLVPSMIGARCQYYFVWKLTEAAGNLSGLGFSGYDSNGRPCFDRLRNVDIVGIETASSLRNLLTAWNKSTAEWLKHFVYLRQAENSAKPPDWAIYLTNAVSALWHGFYPGFYIGFIYIAYCVTLARMIRSRILPYLVKSNVDGSSEGDFPFIHLYNFAGWVAQSFVIHFFAGTFKGLSVQHSLIFLHNMHYLHVLLPIIAHLLVLMVPAQSSSRKATRDGQGQQHVN